MSKTITPVEIRCVMCQSVGGGNALRMMPQDGVVRITLPEGWHTHINPNSTNHEIIYFTCPIHSTK